VCGFTRRELICLLNQGSICLERVSTQKTLKFTVIAFRNFDLSYSSDFTFYVLNLLGGERGQTRLI